MSFDKIETSQQDAEPVEYYQFTYDGVDYCYTSSQYSKTKNGMTFNADFIHRSDGLNLSTSNSDNETCTITVSRTNNVALLYQGAPPEQGSVRVQVYRFHGLLSNDFIKIIDGVVSQVQFNGSEAELTITIENALARMIPKGTLSYYCQNCIYDSKCRLIEDEYKLKCYIDEGIEGLYIYSANLREKPSGYFTDGFIRMGKCYRQIKVHENNRILLKYPINKADMEGSFYAYPGCSGIFEICATRFKNTDNFSGIPYIQPYDAFKHSVGKGAYWVRSDVIRRDTNGEIFTMKVM